MESSSTYIRARLWSRAQSEVLQRLEGLGHRVGESLVERASRDHPRFKNELDAVVFMCKQFWLLAFNKNIDNLKTNHQVGHTLRLSVTLVLWCLLCRICMCYTTMLLDCCCISRRETSTRNKHRQ